MIAPVVIVALISIYYIAIGVIFAYMNGVPMLAKIIALVVPALLSGVAITVLIQRSICSNRRTCAGDKEWRRR